MWQVTKYWVGSLVGGGGGGEWGGREDLSYKNGWILFADPGQLSNYEILLYVIMQYII